MTSLRELIKVYDNVLNEDICARYVRIFKNNKKSVTSYKTGGYHFDQLDLNESVPSECQYVYTKLLPIYRSYIQECGAENYLKVTAMEALRIKKYAKKSTQEFQTHVDVTDYPTARRAAVAIIYLNNNDGSTMFPALDVDGGDLEIKPKTGRVVVFPPMWMFPHAGLTPNDHDKYIMMTCLHYQ